MRITKIYIKSFGKFKNFTLNLEDGFQTIYGENEFGKTTLMDFIFMMFYSRSSMGKGIGNNLRKKYAPWDGSNMDGSIDFVCYGQEYHMEKIFGKSEKSDEIHILRGGTTELSLLPEEEAGERFFGLSADAFARCTFISESSIFRGSDGEDELAERLGNLVSTGDEKHSATKALAYLKSRRERLRSKSGRVGELPTLEQRIEELSTELGKLQEIEDNQMNKRMEFAECEEQREALLAEREKIKNGYEEEREKTLNRMEFQIKDLEEKESMHRKECEEYKASQNREPEIEIRRRFMIPGILLSIFCAVASFYISSYFYAGTLVFLLLAFVIRTEYEVEPEFDPEEWTELQERYNFIHEQLVSRRTEYEVYQQMGGASAESAERLKEIEKELERLTKSGHQLVRELRSLPENPAELEKELSELQKKREMLERKYKVRSLAYEMLEEAMEEQREDFGPELNRVAQNFFYSLTGGNYEKMVVLPNYEIQIYDKEDGHFRSSEYFSQATREQMYLALRFAIADLISVGKESLPIFMDDVLQSYDELREQNALEFFQEQGKKKQIILFARGVGGEL